MLKILIKKEDIQKKIKEVAYKINQDYLSKNIVAICILKGSIFFFTDIVRQLEMDLEINFIRVSSYGSGTCSKGICHNTFVDNLDIKDKDVIIFEDIVDTGLTIHQLVKTLEAWKPKSIRVCTFLNKTERRDKEVIIHYSAFDIEKGFVVGYGLDNDEKQRHLQDLYVLEE